MPAVIVLEDSDDLSYDVASRLRNTGGRLAEKLQSTMTPATEGKLKEAVALNTEVERIHYEIRGKAKSVSTAQAEFFEKKQAVEGLHGEILAHAVGNTIVKELLQLDRMGADSLTERQMASL
eukprot:COSAG01_NODE_50464_length_363_cov_0.784091_1_plen_121_part_11